MTVNIDADQRNADWIKTLSWEYPRDAEHFLMFIGGPEVLEHFMTLPVAEQMPDSLRVELAMTTGKRVPMKAATFTPSLHPRYPAGTPGGLGGQFMPEGARVIDGVVVDDTQALERLAEHFNAPDTVVPGVPDLVSQGWVAGITAADVRDEMTHYVGTVGTPAPELYRGMHNNPDTERFAEQVQDAVGGTIVLEASSFSEDKSVAHEFASMVRNANASEREDAFMAGSVVITVKPGAKSLNVQPASKGYAGDLFAWQKEWVTAGTFRIDSAERSDAGVLHVHLTQIEVPR